MYTNVAEQWLDQEPHMEGVQREFLRRALEYYQEFARDEWGDPKIRFAAATAHRRVGDIYQKLEEGASAEAAYAGAITRFDRLAADYPDRGEYREALGHCHQNLATLLARGKRHADAEGAYLRAIPLREHLAEADATSPRHRFDLAVSLAGYGQLLQADGRLPEADRVYSRARKMLTGLVKDRPDPATHHQLGVVLGRLAELPRDDRWETRELLEKAVWHLQEALKTGPRSREGRDQLAAARVHLARTLVRLGDLKQAAGAYTGALELRERLAADFPRTAHHRRELAAVHTELGDLATAGHESEDARREYARAIALYGRLVEEHPEWPGYARDLAWLLATCPEPTLRDPGRAVTLARRAAEQAPQGGDCWRALGAALCRSGDWAGAVEALDKAVALRGGGDGREWVLLALAHGHLGDREQARRWLGKARGWEDLSAPGNAGLETLRTEAEKVTVPTSNR
jgi:tetratricopeptide (TPR) repeat protein